MSKKIKMNLYRASGLPLSMEDAKAATAKFHEKYTELETTVGAATPENVEIYREELQKVEDECLNNYPRSKEISLSDVPSIISEYKVAVAITLANIDGEEKLAAYLMDSEGV